VIKSAAQLEEDAFCRAVQAVEDMTWDTRRSARSNYRLRVKGWQTVVKHAEEAMRAAAEAAKEAE
jgi:hypothetical protein